MDAQDSRLTEGASVLTCRQEERLPRRRRGLQPVCIEEPDRDRYRLIVMRRTFAAAGVVAILIGACRPTRGPDNDPPKPRDQADFPVDTASSKPVQQGKAYRFVVSTHCGIDWAIDFDGTFWKPTPNDARAYRQGNLDLREPSDRGAMTLISHDEAVYRSKSGSVIHYLRDEVTRPDTPCL